MNPLFACFPMCMTFVAIALIGIVVVVFGLSNRGPADEKTASDPASEAGTPAASDDNTGPPPWWVPVLMVVALVAIMLVLRWYWPE